MRVVALKAWSNGSVSMEERQIAELSDALATSLIAQGIVAPTALPEITDADDGKVLTANSGVWGAEKPNFFVTLTPTSLDYSGTMDKTVSEIYDAYLADKNIIFQIYAESMSIRFPLVDANKHYVYAYPSFDAVLWNVIDNVFMHVSTSFTDDGDKDTYSVSTFPMTYDSANGVSF